MMEDRYRLEDPGKQRMVPEGRYAYYRRCQVFRGNGEQCKAPAEKGSDICYAHAGQRAMARRRELERRAVLAEAVAEMRQRNSPEFEMAELLMDFKGIQVTLAVMARALIDGRIDCRTAGRLAVELQTASKLLWMSHRQRTSTTESSTPTSERQACWGPRSRRHGGKPGTPQIVAEQRRSGKREELPKLLVLSRRWAA